MDSLKHTFQDAKVLILWHSVYAQIKMQYKNLLCDINTQNDV